MAASRSSDVKFLADALMREWGFRLAKIHASGVPTCDGPMGMEAIREMAGRLNALTGDELAELRAGVLAEAERVDGEGVTPETVATLNELAEIGEQVVAETTARAEAQAQAEADAQAARDRIHAVAEPEEDPEAETEPEEDPEAEADPEPEPEDPAAAEQPEPVAAGGGVARMAGRGTRPTASPEATPPEPNRAVLTATGALRGIGGQEITDRHALAEAMADRLRRSKRSGAPTGDVIVASATWQYPEDRRLTDDQDHNVRVIDAVVHPTALVATGGICAPVNVDYSVPTWATAERPLRDGLPAFQATRGGLRYVQPPDIGDLAGATGIWTEATDASPGEATKPVLQVACGDEVVVYVDAVSTRLGFGNMQSRFAPEQVAANTDLAIAAAARIAENNLLDQLEAAAVADVTSAVVLGATRDLITTCEQATSAYRWVHRVSPSQNFTAVMPAWVRDIVKVDLARELAHDNSGAFNVLSITDAQVDDLLRAHGINPIFHLDGQDASNATYPLQGWTAQSASGALDSFPAKVVWYLFPEGTIQFLDGGRLDLGVVRDSTLDATNDMELFVETFENLAFRGFSGGVLQLVTSLCASGATAGTVTPDSCA